MRKAILTFAGLNILKETEKKTNKNKKIPKNKKITGRVLFSF
jgi:hypothetical protein